MQPGITSNCSGNSGSIVGVFAQEKHGFKKASKELIRLVAGCGIEGDAHAGTLVQHLWSARKQPSLKNKRQVHLIESELFDELRAAGFDLLPGDLGENISTSEIELTSRCCGTRLEVGSALIELTGLRQPCGKIDRVARGLRKAVSTRVKSQIALRHGVMGVVLRSGTVQPGDRCRVVFTPAHRENLALVE
jgi:MOSC domain-containing protein YiiM